MHEKGNQVLQLTIDVKSNVCHVFVPQELEDVACLFIQSSKNSSYIVVEQGYHVLESQIYEAIALETSSL